MKQITFLAAYGDGIKTVLISWPTGSAGSIHLIIDNYHMGQIIKYSTGWQVVPQTKATNDELTTDDRMILIDMIKESLGE